MGLYGKVKWNDEKLAEKKLSTHSKTFIDQPVSVWYSARHWGHRPGKWQTSLCPMELTSTWGAHTYNV